MAVKISELTKFEPLDLGDGSNLLVPASKGKDTTKTINVKDLVDHVVAHSTHEQTQDSKLNRHDSKLQTHDTTLQNHATELQTHDTKITNVENIDVWDLTTFH